MDWKRKLELICGLIAGALGIGVTLETLYVTQLTGQMLHERPPTAASLETPITPLVFSKGGMAGCTRFDQQMVIEVSQPVAGRLGTIRL